jgi:hypothetical protein
MSESTGFTTMAGPRAEKNSRKVGIGMLGYAFMGKAHTNAYKKIAYMMYPPRHPEAGCCVWEKRGRRGRGRATGTWGTTRTGAGCWRRKTPLERLKPQLSVVRCAFLPLAFTGAVRAVGQQDRLAL